MINPYTNKIDFLHGDNCNRHDTSISSTSLNTLMMTVSIGKGSYSITMVEMECTSNVQWTNIALFDRLADILKGQIGSD